MPTLHYYTTPIRAREIGMEGLRPQHTFPGTTIPVTFAYPAKAHLAWPSRRHDENPGLARLFLLSVDSHVEGTEGLTHITFEAQPGTKVFDRATLKYGVEAYLMSERVLDDTYTSMIKPEAAVIGTIPPEALTLRPIPADEFTTLLKDYGFTQG